MSRALRIPSTEPVLFASDMHLSIESAATAEYFFDALARGPADARHLFLLGDLFEYWIGDDAPEPLAERLTDALRALVATGMQVWLMRGNRDFLLDTQGPAATCTSYSARCGATLLPDPCPIELHGVPALVSHGDALCTDDTVYQAWRRTCRDPDWQKVYLARPAAERLALARQVLEHSEAGKRERSTNLIDVNPDAVLDTMRAAGATLLVHGHTHRPALHRLDDAGTPRTRVVLPDWDAAAGRGALLCWRDGRPQNPEVLTPPASR